MVCARYTYDAWGKCTVDFDNTLTKIADVNPFRYRGYYYDEEIGLYYLQSRYYDPKVGRFVNCDVITYIKYDLLNYWCYCSNAPVNKLDLYGRMPKLLIPVSTAYNLFRNEFIALSILMYVYAATGAEFYNDVDLSQNYNPIGKIMKKRLKNSKVVRKKVRECIKTMVNDTAVDTKEIYFSPITLHIDDFDLALSVGHASNCKITVKKLRESVRKRVGKKYSVIIDLSDEYDFAKFDWKKRVFY